MRRIPSLSELFFRSNTCDGNRKRQVLIVEDDWLIATALHDMVEQAGCTVVGPATDLAAAIKLARDGEIDAAVLDYRLHAATVEPVAEILTARGIPFALATGFFIDDVPSIRGVPIVAKPYVLEDVRAVLHLMLGDWVPRREDAEPALEGLAEA